MPSRRTFLRVAAALAAAGITGRMGQTQAATAPYRTYLPLVVTAPDPILEPVPYPTPEPIPDPAPHPTPEEPWPNEYGHLLTAPSGSQAQAVRWLTARSHLYTHYDITQIVAAYARVGEEVGVDWFLALAQCAHETGSLTSWWCDRPRRNPAGLGVTGHSIEGSPDEPPGPHWAWRDGRWFQGISFAAWDPYAIRAHIGRLLAYALPAGTGMPAQQAMIDEALSLRPLPAHLRGSALTISDLNGRWAVPGTEYGQRILNLAERMRQA